MSWLLTHLIALWIGALAGFWLAAALINAKQADRALRNMCRRQDNDSVTSSQTHPQSRL